MHDSVAHMFETVVAREPKDRGIRAKSPGDLILLRADAMGVGAWATFEAIQRELVRRGMAR